MNPLALLRGAATVALVCLVIALQSALATRLALSGGQPDFVLTVALLFAIRAHRDAAALYGFGAGLISATLVGQTTGTFLVSRTLAAAAVAGLSARWLRGNVPLGAAAVGVGTLVAEAIYGLGFPAVGIAALLRGTAVEAVLNAAIALPLGLLLRFVLSPSQR